MSTPLDQFWFVGVVVEGGDILTDWSLPYRTREDALAALEVCREAATGWYVIVRGAFAQ